jgi:hypothetical protein
MPRLKRIVYQAPEPKVGQVWQCRDQNLRAIVRDIIAGDTLCLVCAVYKFSRGWGEPSAARYFVARNARRWRWQLTSGEVRWATYVGVPDPKDLCRCLWSPATDAEAQAFMTPIVQDL